MPFPGYDIILNGDGDMLKLNYSIKLILVLVPIESTKKKKVRFLTHQMIDTVIYSLKCVSKVSPCPPIS